MTKLRNIEIKSVISFTTDGAPAMLSLGKGLVGRLVENSLDMITYHCTIHQAVLIAILGDE